MIYRQRHQNRARPHPDFTNHLSYYPMTLHLDRRSDFPFTIVRAPHFRLDQSTPEVFTTVSSFVPLFV